MPRLVRRHSPRAQRFESMLLGRTDWKKKGLLSVGGEMSLAKALQTAAGSRAVTSRVRSFGRPRAGRVEDLELQAARERLGALDLLRR